MFDIFNIQLYIYRYICCFCFDVVIKDIINFIHSSKYLTWTYVYCFSDHTSLTHLQGITPSPGENLESYPPSAKVLKVRKVLGPSTNAMKKRFFPTDCMAYRIIACKIFLMSQLDFANCPATSPCTSLVAGTALSPCQSANCTRGTQIFQIPPSITTWRNCSSRLSQ